MKVFVYCNIRTGTLSVKALEGACKGRVVASVERLAMRDVQFKVSEAGRQRVLKTRRKSVHAGIVGEIVAAWGVEVRELPLMNNDTRRALGVGGVWPDGRPGKRVGYNPYTTEQFVCESTGRAVREAEHVQLDRCKLWAKGLS